MAGQKNKEISLRDERGVRKLAYARYKEGIDYSPPDPDMMETVLQMAKTANVRMKHRGGRPPVFATVEELQAAIDDYWNYLIEANRMKCVLIPDVEGLALYIGVSRETLNQWERNRSEFSDVIKTAKTAIAATKKQMGYHGNLPPVVLAMDMNNNHGYVAPQQKVAVDIRTSPLGPKVPEDVIEAEWHELLED